MTKLSAYAQAGRDSPETLVEQHAPLVKRIAWHLRGRLPAETDMDDLVQVGLIALLEAARSYSPDRGASFETYAGIRIRGAMLDEVRRANWVPRSVYRQQRALSTAIQAVEDRQGTPASSQEIAEELGVSLDEYFRIAAQVATQRMLSLDDGGDEDNPRSGSLPGNDEDDPFSELESREREAALATALAGLPEREALLMSLYYTEELNLREIGEVMGFSESRACQLHAQALARLRARLAPEGGDTARLGQE
ncbi:MAG: RNA polymerase sigma factor FliA [Chromatiales bacterium]|nr:RNA polymerase sigma factor FliA [Chromatiales bacterium]